MSFPNSNTSNTPDYDIDLQPQDLSRRMQHLSNILNHFWKSWRNEHLIELQNAHYHRNQSDTDRTVPAGDVVVVHQDGLRRKWRVGKTLDLIIGSDDCSRGVVVQVQSEGGKHTKLRHPVQRLYPLEIQSEVSVQQIKHVIFSVLFGLWIQFLLCVVEFNQQGTLPIRKFIAWHSLNQAWFWP